MKIACIGRSEALYNAAVELCDQGHEVATFVTSREAPEYAVSAEDFRELANKIGSGYLRTLDNHKIEEHLREIGNLDAGISVNHVGLLDDRVLSQFRFGVLNCHGGDLPRYRGNACQAWALINGETQIGLCVHKMLPGELDSGDILARDYMGVDLGTSVDDCWQFLVNGAPKLFAEALAKLSVDPSWVLEKQSESVLDSLHCYPRKPDDARIDWKNCNLSIQRLINASGSPYPGAFFYHNGRKVTILESECVFDGERFLAVPGQVLYRKGSSIVVSCGESLSPSKLMIHSVSVDGAFLQASNLIVSLRERLN